MPKIDVNEKLFFDLLAKRYDAASLEAVLPAAKAELDGWDDSEEGERTLRIELNDTNRPDLWSTAGVARQLRIREGGDIPVYPFFSREGDARPATRRVTVDPSVLGVRPFMAAFVISGKPVTDAVLRDAIQTQEKLCWNFGRKRASVSMGLYRTALIQWPVVYKAVAPGSVRFVPLQMTESLTLDEILEKHPKGQEYGSINKGRKLHPLLTDSRGGVLSYPPIINSADIGAVQVGDTDLFVELTGTDLAAVTLSASIVACDFADAGYTIDPVAVDYPEPTAFGRTVVFPYYFQPPVSVDSGKVSRMLGRSFSPQAVADALARMGVRTQIHGQYVTAYSPEYRNDFLHPVDVIEDVMMGCGMESFQPERPRDFTIGRLAPVEILLRKAKSVLVGMGYQEMVYNYLGSRRDYVERMNVSGEEVLRIANPMTENFEFVRPSILPSLLGSESVSGKAVYPHRIFEGGKVAFKDKKTNYGTVTRTWLGFLSAHGEANFNEASSLVSALLYYLNEEYSVEDCEDPRFLPGRQARVLRKGKPIGTFGEIHPQVLENWGITVPCVAGEIDIESCL